MERNGNRRRNCDSKDGIKNPEIEKIGFDVRRGYSSETNESKEKRQRLR